MQTTFIRNKHHIHWQKIGLALCLCFSLLSPAIGQEHKTYGMTRGTSNMPNYDDRQMHYGFTIGFNGARFRRVQSSGFLGADTLRSITPRNSPGFSLGFIVSKRLGDYFDLRLLPTVAFYTRKLEYDFTGRGTVEQVSDNTFIEFPLMLKYKSQRRKNLRMYLIGGIKPGIEAGSKKKDKKPTELRTNNLDFCVEYGFGLDIYYPLFKFAPELRISHGLVNMLNRDPNEYAGALSVLTTHTVTLYLNFE